MQYLLLLQILLELQDQQCWECVVNWLVRNASMWPELNVGGAQPLRHVMSRLPRWVRFRVLGNAQRSIVTQRGARALGVYRFEAMNPPPLRRSSLCRGPAPAALQAQRLEVLWAVEFKMKSLWQALHPTA
ncbi:hypothetical protein NQZ68_024762 [Dissostichus eleginoides]|nr:hypothetical protein NQZ68_024762 [Dissostichus eleginoides]